jgi:hypothetical protein
MTELFEGFLAFTKKNPHLITTYCFLHHEALTVKSAVRDDLVNVLTSH